MIILIGVLTTAIIMFEEPSVIEQSSLRGDSTLMHPSTSPMHLLLNWVDHHQYHHDDGDHHHHIINIIIKMMINIIIIVIINIITIPQPPGIGMHLLLNWVDQLFCIIFLQRYIHMHLHFDWVHHLYYLKVWIFLHRYICHIGDICSNMQSVVNPILRQWYKSLFTGPIIKQWTEKMCSVKICVRFAQDLMIMWQYHG